jgi:hypothetical protein
MTAICHEAPTVWMSPPNDEASEAHQSVAKMRYRNGARVDARQR